MAWGKIRRLFLSNLFHRRAAVDMARRRGHCNNCGACCQILFKCPAFKKTDSGGWCTIYDDRPGVCALFPINEKDLRERDIVMPDRSCGFYFVKDDRGLFQPREGKPDTAMVKETLRKLKENPRRRKIVNSTVAILLSKFRETA